MKDITEIKQCPITYSKDYYTYFNLGTMPLVNNLCDTEKESLECKRYPLMVNYFTESGLSCLSHAVSGELLFSNYLFKSGVNVPYIDHCKKMLHYITGVTKLTAGDLIVDIGGNDGTLLNAFRETANKKFQYLNIDPSINLTKLSRDMNIETLTEFFSYDVVKKLNRKAKVITSTNVFQHLNDTNDFVEGVYEMLEDDGIWVLEFPYWIHDLETNQFDQIYHEHIYYYSLRPLFTMMDKHLLKIIRVEKQNIHGGTLRLVMVKNTSSLQPDDSIEKIIKEEEKYDLDYYFNWGKKVDEHLYKCKELILDLKSKGKSIAAFGAAAKGCTFLNRLGLTNTTIDYIIDDTDVKQGKYMPGTGIKIVSRDHLEENHVDYILILAHNFADYIISTFDKKYKFIICLPEIKII